MSEIRSLAKSAALTLKRHYRHGAYRVIRNPDGVVSLWAIESNQGEPFSLSFTDKGRVYNNIDEVPEIALRAFIDYVRKSTR